MTIDEAIEDVISVLREYGVDEDTLNEIRAELRKVGEEIEKRGDKLSEDEVRKMLKRAANVILARIARCRSTVG